MRKYLGMEYMQFQNLAWVVFFVLLGLSYFWVGFFWMAVVVILTKAWVGPSLIESFVEVFDERRARGDDHLVDKIESRIRDVLGK
ncbi:MAG: hypothetical protein H0X64_04235 [Gemmatimonadaceae bacterium]|nr:hypothetical protein [Gemmatimonadaceae bacterium]